jgi:hypothetical protein
VGHSIIYSCEMREREKRREKRREREKDADINNISE